MSEPLPTISDCFDPFDEPFLLLALVSEADYLVTGHRELLFLAAQFTCPIVTVDQGFAEFFEFFDLGSFDVEVAIANSYVTLANIYCMT
ncbi:MAG: hypothetical protein RLZZ381_3370 [Cyanobacteriota bacterium]|jgi:predicted nucleic acid-binding protein